MGLLFRSRISNWNLDKKIYTFITILIYGIMTVMLIIFTLFYFSSFIKQSNHLTKTQLSALAASYENTLDYYKDFAEALTIDDSIQDYLYGEGPGSEGYFSQVIHGKNTLQNVYNMYPSMHFIAVVSYRFDDVLYKGNINKFARDFIQVYEKDYASSMYSCDNGTMRMSFNNSYLSRNEMLNVYIPVYSTMEIFNEMGLLCMILDSSLFEELSENNAMEYDSDVFVVDGKKMIVSCTDKEWVGSEFEYADRLQGTGSDFIENNNLFIFQKVGKWNYYLISRIPLVSMYRDSIVVVMLMVFVTAAMAFFGLIICKRMVKKAYRPLDSIIQGMNSAAEGKLDIRIDLKNEGNDYQRLAQGFNYLMGEINTLMEQVKLEQKQVDQIKFNALQSQIKPHFLYNTLDCIHWQAMAEGSKEISTLVKALAQYYRLCLSDGKDLITLEHEIEHVKSYLIIQNMRYDNIIQSFIKVDETCKKILIPKLTLQPLVENSIYHGIKIRDGKKGVLTITASSRGNDVSIDVKDNGSGMTEEQIKKINDSISEYDKDFGYGVRNVNKRITLLFGDAYGLYYKKNDDGGVTVTIHLPKRSIFQHDEVM